MKLYHAFVISSPDFFGRYIFHAGSYKSQKKAKVAAEKAAKRLNAVAPVRSADGNRYYDFRPVVEHKSIPETAKFMSADAAASAPEEFFFEVYSFGEIVKMQSSFYTPIGWKDNAFAEALSVHAEGLKNGKVSAFLENGKIEFRVREIYQSNRDLLIANFKAGL